MNNPRISVVMPAHNREKFIADSISSILTQSYQRFELIIVDDCSTDHTVDIIKQFDDSRIRLIQHETNAGVAAARNTGYANARGEFIAIADSDDINHPDRLLKKIAYFDNNLRIDVVSCWYQEIDNDNNYKTKVQFEKDDEQIRANWIFNPGIPSFMMFRKQSLASKGLLFHDITYRAAVDYQWYTSLEKQIKLHCIPEILYYYRRHEAQISTEGFTTQQRFANKIRLKQLANIGVHPTDDEFDIHKQMVYGTTQSIDQHSFTLFIKWCEKLKVANEQTQYYHSGNFERLLTDKLIKIMNKDSMYCPDKEKQLIESLLGRYVEKEKPIFSKNQAKHIMVQLKGKVMIFGTKKMGYQIKRYLETQGISIFSLIDNNIENHHKQLEGCIVISPSEINSHEETTIIISVLSEARFTIKEQLIKQNRLKAENIFTLDDFGYGV